MRYLRFVHIFYNARTRKGKGFLRRSRAAKVPGGVRPPILPAFVGFGSTSPPERAWLMSGDKGGIFFADRVAPCVRPCMRGNDKVRVRAWRGGNAFMRIAGMGRQLVIL